MSCFVNPLAGSFWRFLKSSLSAEFLTLSHSGILAECSKDWLSPFWIILLWSLFSVEPLRSTEDFVFCSCLRICFKLYWLLTVLKPRGWTSTVLET